MKNEKGITLIALIITIIVMLILVAVTVSVALQGGLFKNAKEAADKTSVAVDKEQLISLIISKMDVETYTIPKNLGTIELRGEEWTVTAEKEGEDIIITLTDDEENTLAYNLEDDLLVKGVTIAVDNLIPTQAQKESATYDHKHTGDGENYSYIFDTDGYILYSLLENSVIGNCEYIQIEKNDVMLIWTCNEAATKMLSLAYDGTSTFQINKWYGFNELTNSVEEYTGSCPISLENITLASSDSDKVVHLTEYINRVINSFEN